MGRLSVECMFSEPPRTVPVVSIAILSARSPFVTHQRNDLGRLVGESMGKLLVKGDQMCNVDVTVILLHQYVLSYLVTIYEGIVEAELENEVAQLFLDMAGRILGIAIIGIEHGCRIDRLSIHDRGAMFVSALLL